LVVPIRRTGKRTFFWSFQYGELAKGRSFGHSAGTNDHFNRFWTLFGDGQANLAVGGAVFNPERIEAFSLGLAALADYPRKLRPDVPTLKGLNLLAARRLIQPLQG